ncbi:recombinase family protein [Paenibacillus sp. GCM10028914]|uniref:recombinase family protein n=1 Tax=Paenibacillus sp. GCM10028914 TaxID=3273416 RepID=UPI00361DBED3
MSKIIGYCRVSTKAQVDGNSLEQQSQEILSRYDNAELVIEQYSGVKDDRPKFNKMINELQPNDTIVVTKLDRFCRTTKEGLIYVERLKEKGFEFIF